MTLPSKPLSSANHHAFSFLAGGGQMGELTRKYDLENTGKLTQGLRRIQTHDIRGKLTHL